MSESDFNPAAVPLQEAESGPTFEAWNGGGGGWMRLDWNRKGAVEFTVKGLGRGDYAPIVIRRWEAVLRFTGRITLIGDFWDMPAYESAFRVEMAQHWALKHRGVLNPIHIASRSKLVNMGVAVVNLALGGLVTSYTNRAQFDGVVQSLGLPVHATLTK